MMPLKDDDRLYSKLGKGASKVSAMVWSSMTLASVTDSNMYELTPSCMPSIHHFTTSALKSVPSWNLMPFRR
ncbi:MAG: hypothetical protein MAG451_01968 [Anaerolineales bacterium]|nr:hypothetical protein [Anaerolineales bacterium]